MTGSAGPPEHGGAQWRDIRTTHATISAKSGNETSFGVRLASLLDLEAETARLRRLDLGAAYANFFAHLMVPHNVKWDRPPTSWSESMGRMGPQRRAEERMKPEVDRKWAEVLDRGTWGEWLDRSNVQPISSTVWTPQRHHGF